MIIKIITNLNNNVMRNKSVPLLLIPVPSRQHKLLIPGTFHFKSATAINHIESQTANAFLGSTQQRADVLVRFIMGGRDTGVRGDGWGMWNLPRNFMTTDIHSSISNTTVILHKCVACQAGNPLIGEALHLFLTLNCYDFF